MSFKETDQTEFKLTSAFTWGVGKDKYGRYSIPVALDDETAERIRGLAKEHGAKDPVYGSSKTLYLRSKKLSDKQTEELYNKGRSPVEVHFTAKGTNTKGDTSYLTFKVTRLRKIEKPESDDSCPED